MHGPSEVLNPILDFWQTYLEQHPDLASEAVSWVIVGIIILLIAFSLLLFSEVLANLSHHVPCHLMALECLT